jgi:hypothetical protein
MAKPTTDNTSKVTEATTKVVKLLSGLDSGGRQKVIQASMTILGETALDLNAGGRTDRGSGEGDAGRERDTPPGLPLKASVWIRQNSLTIDQLQQVFDIDGANVSVIAGSVPGKSSKDQTIAAYVLRGVAQLLATGDPTFDDKSARRLCEDLGCYNSANHSVYMNAIGNSVTGSKDKGWKLTAPGMKKGADLIKEMAKGA